MVSAQCWTGQPSHVYKLFSTAEKMINGTGAAIRATAQHDKSGLWASLLKKVL
jgi:hypothetical protein